MNIIIVLVVDFSLQIANLPTTTIMIALLLAFVKNMLRITVNLLTFLNHKLRSPE